jgi:hypothetical protein
VRNEAIFGGGWGKELVEQLALIDARSDLSDADKAGLRTGVRNQAIFGGGWGKELVEQLALIDARSDLSDADKAGLRTGVRKQALCQCTERVAISLSLTAVSDVDKDIAAVALSKFANKKQSDNPHLAALKSIFEDVLETFPLLGLVNSKDADEWDTMHSSQAQEIQEEQYGVTTWVERLGRPICEMRIRHYLDMHIDDAEKIQLQRLHSTLRQSWRWQDDIEHAGEPEKRGESRPRASLKGLPRTVFPPASILACKVLCVCVSGTPRRLYARRVHVYCVYPSLYSHLPLLCQAWLDDHKDRPYPTTGEKEELCKTTTWTLVSPKLSNPASTVCIRDNFESTNSCVSTVEQCT